ncbi:50S ribosomal protein L5 [Candidatus Vidania fulgoroideorum]
MYIIREESRRNIMLVPKIEKIVVNNAMGKRSRVKNFLNRSIEDIANITGQYPLIIRAKKSIANFSIKRNEIISLKVTLRNLPMYNFLYKLIHLVFPRMRGVFRIDNDGNINIGISDRCCFPEIERESSDGSRTGYDISIVTNCKDIVLSKKFFGMIGLYG